MCSRTIKRRTGCAVTRRSTPPACSVLLVVHWRGSRPPGPRSCNVGDALRPSLPPERSRPSAELVGQRRATVLEAGAWMETLESSTVEAGPPAVDLVGAVGGHGAVEPDHDMQVRGLAERRVLPGHASANYTAISAHVQRGITPHHSGTCANSPDRPHERRALPTPRYSLSSDSAASGRSKRCARPAPLPRSRSLPGVRTIRRISPVTPGRARSS